MLTIESTIVIPLRYNDGTVIEQDKINRHLALIANEFGGYTSNLGSGGWVDSSGTLLVDDIMIVSVSVPLSKFFRIRSFLSDMARAIKSEFAQQSVYVNIGRFLTYFI